LSTRDVEVGSTTLTLVVVSCAFLVFNVPLDVYFLGYHYAVFSSQRQQTVYTIATLLSYTNNATVLSSGVGTMGTGGTLNPPMFRTCTPCRPTPQVKDAACVKNFKQTTLTTTWHNTHTHTPLTALCPGLPR